MKQRVGMVGIGMMGHGIASNIVKHGHALTVMEHPGNQPLDALKAAGAVGVATPADVAAQSDVIILVLTGAPEVEAVLTGERGVLAGLRPGAVVIDCSTSLPATSVKMAAAVEAAGGRFLDAPMTRTPKEAAEGRLNLLVGGDAALLEESRPLLACFAENILHAGAIGSGHSMKLVHNFVSLGFVALLSEAAVCAQSLGIAPDVFVDILAKGGGKSVALDRLSPFLLSQDTSSLRFSVANAVKDTSYYQAMVEHCGTPETIAQAVLSSFRTALQADAHALVPELPRLLAARR